MIKRKGKIARLPNIIRETLNLRLQDGEPASSLATWLNSLPEVQQILAGHFNGRPINEQNLCDWKQGGLRDWEEAEEEFRLTLLLTENFGAIREQLGDREPAECLIPQLVVQLSRLLRKCYDTDFSDPADERRFFKICDRIMRLRAFEQKDVRLSFDRERASFTAAPRRMQSTGHTPAARHDDSAVTVSHPASALAPSSANPPATASPNSPSEKPAFLAANEPSRLPCSDVNQSKSNQIKDCSRSAQSAQSPALPAAAAPASPILKVLTDPHVPRRHSNGPRDPLVGRIVPLQPTLAWQAAEFSTFIPEIPAAEKKNVAQILGLSLEAFEAGLDVGGAGDPAESNTLHLRAS